MKILVTGGGGFVGSAIVARLLARGDSVRSLGRSPQPGLAAQGVEVVCGSLADPEVVACACSGVDAVFHVAAKAGVWGSWDEFYRPNVLGTQHVLAACRAEGVGRLVYTSTPSVVFNGQSISGGDERLPYGTNWLCAYAETKAIAEKAVLEANDAQNFRVVALRPHLIFGPGDPHLLPRVVESATAGRLKIIGDGRNRVDVSYIDDVADAHLNALDALDRGAAGNAYFISQGEPVELWPWINQILQELGHPRLVKRVPLSAAYGIACLCEVLWKGLRLKTEPPLTRFVAVELAKDHYFDLSAARRDLGYAPKIPMETALLRTIENLKQRGFGRQAP